MAGIGSSTAFTVTRNKPELVAPATPNPHELKQLSDMDNSLDLRFFTPTLFFYKNNPSKVGQDPVRVMKEALAKALVFYYPLAGRVVEGSNRKLSVDCNGEGVLFVEAFADITLDQLGDSILSPYKYLDEVLHNVPGSDHIIGCPIILVQVTRLLCGGFIFAVRLNHTMCDGVGLGQFLQAVAEIARGVKVPSILPVWEREMFIKTREPPRITPENQEKPVSLVMNETPHIVQRSFLISQNYVKSICLDLPQHLAKSTSYELLTACLWKCFVRAWNSDPEDPVFIMVAASARDKKYNLNVSQGYYGNAVGIPHAMSKSKHICEKPLANAVEVVKAAKKMMTVDYFSSMKETNQVVADHSQAKGHGVLVVSDVRFAGDINFGWGSPVHAGPVIKQSQVCYLTKYKNFDASECIAAVISLPEPVMYRFEVELKNIMATNILSKL